VTSASHRLSTVQGARGIAAIAVVLAHASTVLGAPLHGIFRAGHAGVDFFFVLSGFIITLVHHRDIGHPSFLTSYLWRRLIRIYPVYWIALALLGLLIASGIVREVDPVGVLATLFLLPEHHPPLLGVSWTLQHEMLFYLLFALAIVGRRLGIVVLATWLVLIMASSMRGTAILPWAPDSLLWDFVAAPFHLQFMMGIAVAAVVVINRVPVPRVLLAIGIAGIACTATLEDAGWIAYLGLASKALFGGFSACAIAGMAAAERKGLLTVDAAVTLLGEASYSIYLVHYPAIAMVLAVFAASGTINIVPAWLMMTMLATTGVVAGIALHLLAERPILKWLRNPARITVKGPHHAARETA